VDLAESNGSLPPTGFDLRHLEADCQDQLQNPTLGNRVWATFTFLPQNPKHCSHFRYCRQKERWSSAAATDAY